MQNAECRMQNKGIFFENQIINEIIRALARSIILHFTFYILHFGN